MSSYVANTLWQFPIFFAGAWLIIRTTAAGPRLQHRIWIAVLLLAVVMPSLNPRAASFFHTITPKIVASDALSSPAASRERARSPLLLGTNDANNLRNPGQLSPLRLVTLAPNIIRWMIPAYLLSILMGALRLGRAWLAARRMLQRSTPTIASDRQVEVWAQCAARMGMPLPPIRTSADVASPALLGVARTVLLLPTSFAHVTEEDARAALLHELAHLRRRDCLANLLMQLAMLPVFWHPVAHALARRISITREMVCDAMAAQAMQSERRYAGSLISLARQFLPQATTHQPIISLFSTNSLEERVMRIMCPGRVVSLRTKLLRVASGSILAYGTLVVATLFHITPVAASASRQVSGIRENAIAPAPAETLASPPMPISQAVPSAPSPVHVRVLAVSPSSSPAYLTAAAQGHPDTNGVVQPEEVQRQVEEALRKLDMHEVDGQAEKVRRQVEEAMGKLDSPEFKQQMEAMQKQLQESERQLQRQWPAWDKQVEEAQRQAAEATAKLNSPEFKHQMEAMTKQIESGELERQVKEAERRLQELEKHWNQDCPR